MAATEYNAAEMVAVDDPIETEGANDPWQLAQLERAFQRRQVRALCALGVRFADPARVDIRGEVTAEQDVEIDVDVVFEGRVALGEGVRIGPFCRIRNANLAAGTEIRAHCDIDRSEEHTSELQSLMRISYAVFCLKKKKKQK